MSTIIIGDSGNTSTLTLGGTNTTSTTIKGTSVDVVTKLTTPVLDCLTDASAGNVSLAIGGTATVGNINIGASQTTGILNIGTGSRTGAGAINIGTNATGTHAITVGTTGQTTIGLNGTSVNVGTKLTTPVLDCLTDALAGNVSLAIGGTAAVGNINIGASQTSGVLNIGTNARTGILNIGTGARTGTGAINIGNGASSTATINIGVSGVTTNISGTLTTSLGTIAGATGYLYVNTNTSLPTLPTEVNINFFVLVFGSAGPSGSLIIPSNYPGGQTIDIKNYSTSTISVQFLTTEFFPYGTRVGVTATTILSGSNLKLYLGPSQVSPAVAARWYQLGPSDTFPNDLTIGSNKTIFTTSGQQIRLGYATTQTTGLATSTFGPFFKSFGPATVTGLTYDIILTGSTDAIFQPSNIDGMGGLLMIMIKNITSTSKGATFTYSINKRVGITGINSLSLINTNAGGWTTTPTLGTTGINDNIRITFINLADWTGSIVSWTFMGS